MDTGYDLIIIGAGSGGIGAALAAGRFGLRTLLVEKADKLGGTSTIGGVNTWEMGVGGTGIPFDIYQRLRRVPQAVGIYSYGRHWCWQKPDEPYRFPGGEQLIDPERAYLDTLRRHGCNGMGEAEAFVRQTWHGVTYEPDELAATVEAMLAEMPSVDVCRNTTFEAAETAGNRVASVTLNPGGVVQAGMFIDCSADAVLALSAGCRMMFGQESRRTFNEPGAPEKANNHLNAATLVYRISPAAAAAVEPLPEDISGECWWRDRFPGACINQYPNGDRNINMLPTMDGEDAFKIGPWAAYRECRNRVRAHWHYLQTNFDEFRNFRFKYAFPVLGVRESRRVVGRYVLTQHDLLAGISGQDHDDIVTLADHAMDTHGTSTGRAGCGELHEPYGVPFRCLVAADLDNLLVACRAASFSSVAASSCRLSRTMIQLGQAAGTAAAIAAETGCDPGDVPAGRLHDALQKQHVQLEWPMPAALKAHLGQVSSG